MKLILSSLFFVLLFAEQLPAQSFIFDQLFRPSIRLNTAYSHDIGLQPHKDQLHIGQVDVNCIIPIASKLQLKIDWDKMLQLRLKKVAKLRLYQIFWNFRPKVVYTQLRYQDSSSLRPFLEQPHLSYGISTGITGVHLLPNVLKKPKFLFYQFNVGILESRASLQASTTVFRPDITGLVGVAHVQNLGFYWYCGLYLSYSNGQFLPVPFFGMQAKLSKRIWVNVTLPVQVRFAFQLSRKVKLDVGVSLAGFGTPFGTPLGTIVGNTSISSWQRYSLIGIRVKTGMVWNIKLSSQTTIYLEAGAYPYQIGSFRGSPAVFEKPNLGVPIYGGFSLYYAFRKSLLGSVIDGIIMF